MSSTLKTIRFAFLSLALVLGALFTGAIVTSTPSKAVVYCAAGVYRAGCVARPVVPPARVVYCTGPGYPRGCVVRPAAPRHVVYCTRVGYPRGCVMRY
ncbi:hypothetical protein OSH11_17370 [Kaistia dalseonensis]|uniref:Secreted protein n=1 Tax=Kaistia dalseonensis TaxID=410840 RepID=A0ABU0H9V4_9HYPH|nr:hypothetical protein [Kaistia dalseonensis]MCX5496480.1 hypothetical protein [Kaistia dalseonensis]MDQ0439102.1 hypothetical protein [Kaistia dalseonensis]